MHHLCATSQKGQVLILTVIMLPILVILSVFTIELGFLYIRQTELQSAADAIALAGLYKYGANDSTDKDNIDGLIAENVNTIRATVTVVDTKKENDTCKVHLTEAVTPIFSKIFGTETIVTIEAYSAYKDGKFVPYSEQ